MKYLAFLLFQCYICVRLSFLTTWRVLVHLINMRVFRILTRAAATMHLPGVWLFPRFISPHYLFFYPGNLPACIVQHYSIDSISNFK